MAHYLSRLVSNSLAAYQIYGSFMYRWREPFQRCRKVKNKFRKSEWN